MKQEYYINVKVAGVNLHFVSDLEVDICLLREMFKHHLADNKYETIHIVRFTGINRNIDLSDAKFVWKGYYHGDNDSYKTVRKYVSANDKYEYFKTSDGYCIIYDKKENITTCTIKTRRIPFLTGRIRKNIDSIIILLFHIVMARHRRYSLHASAVLWRNEAIIFPGKSGQGKSTLCTDLVAQGAGFMGDDIVFVYMEDGILRIGSLLFDAQLFGQNKSRKEKTDVIQKYNGAIIESAPLHSIVAINQTREGNSSIEDSIKDEILFDTLLASANNIAIQYDYDDWISLCAHIFQTHHLHTICFGDRKLFDAKILDSLYE